MTENSSNRLDSSHSVHSSSQSMIDNLIHRLIDSLLHNNPLSTTSQFSNLSSSFSFQHSEFYSLAVKLLNSRLLPKGKNDEQNIVEKIKKDCKRKHKYKQTEKFTTHYIWHCMWFWY